MKGLKHDKAESSSETSDEWLMRRFAQGNDEYFTAIYQRYSGRVYGYLKKKLSDQNMAEEIFQEVFLKLVKSRQSFKSDGHFAPWLFSIVRNSMIDGLRRKAHQTNILEALSLAPIHTPENEVKEDFKNLESILGSLTDKDKKILTLRYVDDLSFANIALRTGLSVVNVRQIASRAINKLRKEHYEKND